MTRYPTREWSSCTLLDHPEDFRVNCSCALRTVGAGPGVCVPVCNVSDVPLNGMINEPPGCTAEDSGTCLAVCRDGFVAFASTPPLPANITCVAGTWSTLLFCAKPPICDVCYCNWVQLDCDGMNRTEIPGIFPQQTELIMRNNALTELNEVSFSMSHSVLTSLSVTLNPITHIEIGSFDLLSALTTLDLQDLLITELLEGVFDPLRNLQTLFLGISAEYWPARRGLSLFLPPSVFAPLAALSALTVSGVRLESTAFLSMFTFLEEFNDLALVGVTTEASILPLPAIPTLRNLYVGLLGSDPNHYSGVDSLDFSTPESWIWTHDV